MKWTAFFGITLIGFLAFLDFTIVNTALPVIQKELHMSVISLQWIMNIYFLVLAICMVMGGKFGDIFGHRKFFEIGSIIFLLASILAGLAMSGPIIILGRFFQAIGSAIVFPLAASLLNEIFHKQKTKAFAIYGAIGGMGLAVGPVLGAILTTYISWRAIFFINVPISLIGLIICFFTLERSKSASKVRIDWAGFVLYALGIGGIVYGVIESAKSGWDHPLTIISLLVGVISLVSYGVYQSKKKDPFIDFRFFRKPLFCLGALSCMTGGIMSAILLFFLPLYLHTIRNVSVLETGLIVFSMTLIYTIFSFFINKVAKSLSLEVSILMGMVFAILASLFFYPLDLSISVYMAIVPCAFIGITWAIGNILSIVAAQDAVTQDKIGIATGVVYSVFNTGGAIVLAIAIAVFKSVETSFLENKLARAAVHLSKSQQHDITVALSNPSEAEAYLSHLSSRVVSYFREAFVEGFHGVATLTLIVMIIVLLGSIVAKMKAKKA